MPPRHRGTALDIIFRWAIVADGLEKARPGGLTKAELLCLLGAETGATPSKKTLHRDLLALRQLGADIRLDDLDATHRLHRRFSLPQAIRRILLERQGRRRT
jgi:hypothetical protein